MHNLHMHPSGFQFLISPLNSGNEFEFLITSGTRAQVFGPLKDIVSVPFPTVRTLNVLKVFLLLTL